MPTAALDRITTFQALIDYLRDELEWPFPEDATIDDTTYSFTPAELGLKKDVVGGDIEILQLRPLTANQPWGVFYLNLPNKNLPQTIVRNILGKLTVRKRASANDPLRPAFAKHDLLFITQTGADEQRKLAFAHFKDDAAGGNAASLKVLGWEADDTTRRRALTEDVLRTKLHWPDNEADAKAWRDLWGGAFTEGRNQAVRTSKDLARTLAKFAQGIRDRAKVLIAAQTDKGSLVKLHKAFKDALIHDLTPDAFADTYAQTITYGLLSTAMSRASGALTQQDMLISVMTTSPFLKNLLESFIEAGGHRSGPSGDGLDFDELGIGEVVDFLRDIDMVPVLADFDQKNSDKDPVVWLYQDFIEQYDKAQKFQRGVFYTPRQVVGFIVRSVDEVLRTELGLKDGLASIATWGEVIAAQAAKGNAVALPEGTKAGDPFVRILDPATGTGTFLVETVDLIWKTMTAKWRAAGKSKSEIAALWNAYVPEHLLPRLYGYELMMAPYAIAHMKLGLKLYDTGYRFASDARLRVHLTNALEPAKSFAAEFDFVMEAMANEAMDANAAKSKLYTVIFGNPPYASLSSNLTKELRKIVDPYRFVDGEKIVERSMLQFEKNIQDDYIKFIRLCETASSPACSVWSMITNHSYIDGITLRGVRGSLLDTHDTIEVLDLHGNANKNESKSEGITDENVFEIRQGVAIIGCARLPNARGFSSGDLWGQSDHKVNVLENSILSDLCTNKEQPRPKVYSFRPIAEGASKREWPEYPPLEGVFPFYSTGVETGFDDLMQSLGYEQLTTKLARFDASTSHEIIDEYGIKKGHALALAKRKPRLTDLVAEIDYLQVKPFDHRPTLLHKPLLKTNAAAVMRNVDLSSPGLVSTRQTKEDFGVFAIGGAAGHKITSSYDRISAFPLWIKSQGTETRTLPNIAPIVAKRVATLTGLAWDDCVDAPKQGALAGVVKPKDEQVAMFAERHERGDLARTFGPRDLFDWIYAVLHSPAYRARYADYLKSDFARIPLPGSRVLFAELVPLGTKLVALHLLDTKAAPDLADPRSVRLAGPGDDRVTLKAAEFEKDAWKAGRMYISADRWFETVPQRVADFHIGGYRPARKWLKDRTAKGGKKASEGRILTGEDQLHYRRMIVAMDKTIDLMAEIDRVIDKHGGWPGAFKGMTDEPKAAAAE